MSIIGLWYRNEFLLNYPLTVSMVLLTEIIYAKCSSIY